MNTVQVQRSNSMRTSRKHSRDDRKGIPKNVTWNLVAMNVVQQASDDPYEGVNQSEIWYSSAEMTSILQSNQCVVADHAGRTYTEDKAADQEDSMRGLEAWTQEGAWEHFRYHRDCIDVVMNEQEAQWQNKELVVNSNTGRFDEDRLRDLSFQVTATPKDIALSRGKQDFFDMRRTITPEVLELQHQGRFAAYLATRRERLEGQKRERQMAGVEWEQKRKARRTALCKEADKILAKVESKISRANELLRKIHKASSY